MTNYLLDSFQFAQYITHPISLAAYAVAAVMTYFVSRNVNRRKEIESVREADRAKVIIATAEKLNINLKDIPENERGLLVKKVLSNRITSQIILAFVIVVLGLLTTIIVLKSIGKGNAEMEKTGKESSEIHNEHPEVPSQNATNNSGTVVQIHGDSNVVKLNKDSGH